MKKPDKFDGNTARARLAEAEARLQALAGRLKGARNVPRRVAGQAAAVLRTKKRRDA